MSDSPKLYNELAEWWPLMSVPEDYAEEAGVYSAKLVESGASPLRSVLELGSGGGNNASHMKAHFDLTLVELSAGMLEVSKRLNPECEHHQGDMRTVRLGRQFDGVFVHDAVCYMTTPDDLWAWDPDKSDTTYLVDYAYLLRTGTDTRVVHDRHVEGLFGASTWLDTLRAVGFDAQPQPYRHSEVERPNDVFVARRP